VKSINWTNKWICWICYQTNYKVWSFR